MRLDGRVGGAGAAGTTFRGTDGERGKEDGLVVGKAGGGGPCDEELEERLLFPQCQSVYTSGSQA